MLPTLQQCLKMCELLCDLGPAEVLHKLCNGLDVTDNDSLDAVMHHWGLS